jgi:hypothetical protein
MMRRRHGLHVLQEHNFTIIDVVLWLRQLVVRFSPRRTGLDPRPVLERSVVDKVAVGQVSLHVLLVFPCQYRSINAPYSSSSMYMLRLPEGQSGQALEPSKKQCSSGNRITWDKKYFYFHRKSTGEDVLRNVVSRILNALFVQLLWLLRPVNYSRLW